MNYDQVFDEVFPALHRYCERLTGDPDAADEASQEAFVRLYCHEIDGPDERVRAWLFRVATNVIRDRQRVTKNRRRLLERFPIPDRAAPEAERAVEREEEKEMIRTILDHLGERDRQLLLMREEGFSYREMADAAGVKPGSVGTLLVRAEERFVRAYESVRFRAGPQSDTEDHERA